MAARDEFVELFGWECEPGGTSDRDAIVVGLAVRGYDMARDVAESDVLVDRLCGRDLRSWIRVSVRRSRHEARSEPVVLATPMRELTTEPVDGIGADLDRGPDLDADGIKALLRSGTVRFVVADPGLPLVWVAPARTFAVWRHEVAPRLIDLDAAIPSEPAADGYRYRASSWTGAPDDSAVVLLERRH